MFNVFQKVMIVVSGMLILIPFGGPLRRRAWLKVAIGAFAEAVILTGIQVYKINPENRFLLWLLALPLVCAGAGAMELITGTPFLKLADHWNGLGPTRREQISFFAIVFTLGLFTIACVLYVKICTAPWRWP